MELRQLHKDWIKSLRDHPERQIRRFLCKVPENAKDFSEYKACCLGELKLLSINKDFSQVKIDDEYKAVSFNGDLSGVSNYIELGLKDPIGGFRYSATINNRVYFSLVQMNDEGLSWTTIADYIESNPENVFNYI